MISRKTNVLKPHALIVTMNVHSLMFKITINLNASSCVKERYTVLDHNRLITKQYQCIVHI